MHSMALRRTLSKRMLLYNANKIDRTSHLGTLDHSSISSSSSFNSTSAALKTLLDSSKSRGFFQRFLQQKREINQAALTKLPEFLSIPVGDKLREKLRAININPGERIQFDWILPPAEQKSKLGLGGFSATDARKILRSSQLEKVRLRLRQIPANSISYNDYAKICEEVCENREQGSEFAKMLDEAGSVIIVGNVVFIRPDQVAKSMEKMMSESIGVPNDPRRSELDEMEKQKAMIDQKAESQAKGELYCGLGFLVLQTLGFMRLTFWELSWDVMEPICFFVTSVHFALAYAFFLRTSKEPSFEGYFQRRFRSKQTKLMKIHNFDIEKYNHLYRAFYPSNYENQPWLMSSKRVHYCKHNDHHARGAGAVFGSIMD